MEEDEEDAGRDAPQTAWGKMPQPLRPVNGLGRTRQPRRLANGLAQDAPATTRRARHGRKLSTLPPLVGSGEARKPDGIFLAGRLIAISGEIVTAEIGTAEFGGGFFRDFRVTRSGRRRRLKAG